MKLRKLNDEGVSQFREYINSGATGPAPVHLLENPETSEILPHNIIAGTAQFADRYLFGVYLRSLLNPFDPAVIANDRNFWSSLGLLWFDRLCPADASGKRDVKEDYRYILSADYRHYYRHLVRSPWQLVRDHGGNAQLLLIAPRENANPLSIHGEILEQFGGRQQVLASRSIIGAAHRMYFDTKTGRPRKGVAGSGPGSARRFGLVLRQLDLTYDAECMPDGSFMSILPGEFDRWKAVQKAAGGSKLQSAGQMVAGA
jgi:hypothetical protein